MAKRLRLVSLTLIGSNKNYCVQFQDGLNLISGPTSTGKTSILEMIDYALGAKEHKHYIEIGKHCTAVELEVLIGSRKIRIRRRLFEFSAPVVVEEWEPNKGKYLFYNRYEIDSPSNPQSLSAFLLEQLDLSGLEIAGQTFSFRDIFKYSYLRQTEIDSEDIQKESSSWPDNNKRKATFEVIFGILDDQLESLKASLKDKEDELKTLSIQIEGIKAFTKNMDFSSEDEYTSHCRRLTEELNVLNNKLHALREDAGLDTKVSESLRMQILSLKHEVREFSEKESVQQLYLTKLNLLLNQYYGEIEKKEMAIEGYSVFNKYQYQYCPNCLKPLTTEFSEGSCCLCGSEMTGELSELVVLKKEVTTLRRKANELLAFIEKQESVLSAISKESKARKSQLTSLEDELIHLLKGYKSPHMEQIEQINYEIGRLTRLKAEAEQGLAYLEEIGRQEKIIDQKASTIAYIKANIKVLRNNRPDKNELIDALTKLYASILEAFQFPKLSAAYVDEKSYLPYIRGVKYSSIGSLAGVTLVTMAYYLAVLIKGIEAEYLHLGLLMLDSPRKNLGTQDKPADDIMFRDEKIYYAIMQYFVDLDKAQHDQIQLIVVNNGYPESFPHDAIIVDFNQPGADGSIKGLIDDA